jgi:hypothetical protein
MKKEILAFGFILASTLSWAGTEGMPSMPKIEGKTYILKGDENLDEQKGFGENESRTKMTNLMMVEGSGYEGMDMDAMKVADSKTQAQNSMSGMNGETKSDEKSVYDVEVKQGKFKVGNNLIEFTVKKSGKEVKGLRLKSQVYMTSMDMGTEEPKVKDIGGKYQVKASFTMKGPWAIKLIFPDNSEKVLNFEVSSK